MDPITRLLVPGLAGGIVVAGVLFWLNHRLTTRSLVRQPEPDQRSTDLVSINMASIRVMGIGGLGLVATCAIVAVNIPTVGLSLATGFALGTVFAVVMILRRKKSGPMPSSGQRPGANTVLSIDEPDAPANSPASFERGRHHVAPAHS